MKLCDYVILLPYLILFNPESMIKDRELEYRYKNINHTACQKGWIKYIAKKTRPSYFFIVTRFFFY